MKRFASVCDLERQAPVQHDAPPAATTSKPLLLSESASRRQVQCIVMLAVLSLMCVFSSAAVVVSMTTSGGNSVRVLERIKAFIGIDPSAPMKETWEWQSEAVDKSTDSLHEREQAQMHREIALSLSHFAQQTPIARGLVLPLFDDIAHLGLSAILELRALGVDLPIEIPHCGDFKPAFQQMIEHRDPLVRVYDVCAQALDATNLLGSRKRLFCGSPQQCHKRFRDFNIKIIAVVFSQFQELMLVDADTVFFQSPMTLWDLARYNNTGTLFFHDRVSTADKFLAAQVATTASGKPVSRLHAYLSKFDVSPYRSLASIPRRRPSVANAMPSSLRFAPSDFLLMSHSWNLRAGHEMDSSLVLWSKRKQPRATAILASFLALNGVPAPPSYGDKELFFIACELAETQYAFSDFGVGSLGTDLHDHDGKPDSVLCGGGLHYFPATTDRATAQTDPSAALLYLNSDDILALNVQDPIYRTIARPADVYAGSFAERGIPQECPFDITAVELTQSERAAIAQRQQLHQDVQSWTLQS